MKQATHFLLTVWILCLAVVVPPVFADVAREQALCVTDKTMAESIQHARIATHDSLSLYKKIVLTRSKPGKPLGNAITPEQIAEKDAFWRKNIDMAEIVYEFYSISLAPEYVGNQILIMCQWQFEMNARKKDEVQKFEL